MRRIVIVAAVSVLTLTGCASTPVADDAEACKAYADVISDWAMNTSTSVDAMSGVAMKLRTEAAAIAGEDLAAQIKIMADVIENNMEVSDLSAAQKNAGGEIKASCSAVGVEY